MPASRSPETIALAYYQASLLVEHIVAALGQAALRQLLVAYGEGIEGEAALDKGLGVVDRRSCRRASTRRSTRASRRCCAALRDTALDRWSERAEAAGTTSPR